MSFLTSRLLYQRTFLCHRRLQKHRQAKVIKEKIKPDIYLPLSKEIKTFPLLQKPYGVNFETRMYNIHTCNSIEYVYFNVEVFESQRGPNSI